MTEVSVCVGTSCHLKGSYNIVQTFQQKIEELGLHDEIKLKATFCTKQCQRNSVSVLINEKDYDVTPEIADDFFDEVIMATVNTK